MKNIIKITAATAAALGLIALVLWFFPGSYGTSTLREAQRQVEPTDAEIKAHAIAFGAIIDTINSNPQGVLSEWTVGPTPQEFIDSSKAMTAKYWDIHSREELLDTLNKMQSGIYGQRAAFWEIRRAYMAAFPENFTEVLTATNDHEEMARRFIVATRLAAPLGKAMPITAWDFARCINLCRWGHTLSWLSEQEAWDRILPIARLLQASYGSWNEFEADYLLGRNFWAPDLGKEDNNKIRLVCRMLARKTGGVWGAIPWDQSLGKGPIAVDTYQLKAFKQSDPDWNWPQVGWQPEETRHTWFNRTSVGFDEEAFKAKWKKFHKK